MTIVLTAVLASNPLTVRDGQLTGLRPDGGVVTSNDLVGSVFNLGTRSVRLTACKREESTGLTLHHLVFADGGAEFCLPDFAGERWAAVMPAPQGVEFVCTSGAKGKCLRFGYREGALHEACVKMVRADYAGDGGTATRDGVRIQFCDRSGIHPCEPSFVAFDAWSTSGAVCVSRPRAPEVLDLDGLRARFPALFHPACSTGDPRAILFSRVVTDR